MKKGLFILSAFFIGILVGVAGLHFYEIHQIIPSQYTATLEDSLKDGIWNGDIDAYTKLQGDYRDYPPESFLFWAMYMANKYDYSYAYEDVFTTIEDIYNVDSAIFKMDEKTRTFALGYLKIAAQKGDSNAINRLNAMSQEHVPNAWLK